MTVRSVVFFVILGGISVSANSEVTFPEIARASSTGPNRIVSGWLAEEGQFPYIMRMRMVSATGSVASCGATIIHQEWGLTAAHCTALRVQIVLRAGGVNLTRPEVLFETPDYYNHPDYDNDNWQTVQQHDISLLRFGRTLGFSDRVQAIRVQPSADRDRNYGGNRLLASGWGQTFTYATQDTTPEHLNWVYLEGVSNIGCWFAYNGALTVYDTTVCAGPYNVSTQGVCQGDSGGPLVLQDDDGQLTQIGITSFTSSRGCHVRFPGGFVRPGHYHEWFREVTGIQFDWNTSTKSNTHIVQPGIASKHILRELIENK